MSEPRPEAPGTRYDHPDASDGHGGPHPLAGVPQSALDAATDSLTVALNYLDADDPDAVRSVAEAVLMSGLVALRQAGPPAR